MLIRLLAVLLLLIYLLPVLLLLIGLLAVLRLIGLAVLLRLIGLLRSALSGLRLTILLVWSLLLRIMTGRHTIGCLRWRRRWLITSRIGRRRCGLSGSRCCCGACTIRQIYLSAAISAKYGAGTQAGPALTASFFL